VPNLVTHYYPDSLLVEAITMVRIWNSSF